MKRFYNWFHKYYGGIEKSLGPTLDEVLGERFRNFPGMKSKTVVEYACGSGLLSLKLARYFKSVHGMDISQGMIDRAYARAKGLGMENAYFSVGNILAPDQGPGSFDYVFVSHALHLFSPQQEQELLRNLLAVAKEKVIIIDHGRKWELMTAIVEWLEGGYYEKFIKIDFSRIASAIGASGFEETQVAGCTVLEFLKR